MTIDTERALSTVSAYGTVRDRIRELVADLDEATAGRPVPATPLWTVRDVLAHLVGVCDDAIHGRIEGAATDPWTAAQVEARRDRSIAELLAEWEERWPPFAALLGELAAADVHEAGKAVLDAATHEQDLRMALGRPPNMAPEVWPLFIAIGVRAIGERRDGRGAGPLAIHIGDGGDHIAGSAGGSPTGSVTVSAFELSRAMTGRRSRDQIHRWRWEGDWRPEDVCFFPPRLTDFVEPGPR